MGKKIIVSDLEFDDIKSNLRAFLSSQSEFTDYNFEGSALSVLLDVLAYNTHYNALYDNMLINESFLDSANKRDSVISRANDLGYFARSAKCSTAKIKLQLNPSSIPADAPSILVVDALTPFTSSASTASYTFFNNDAIVLTKSGGSYVANDITVTAGLPNTYPFFYNSVGTRFVLPNNNIDISTIKVTVFESANANSRTTTFTQASNVVTVDGNSNVFWIKEVDNQLYELKFGDGIIGAALTLGNMVKVDYMTSYGSASNGILSMAYGGIKSFSYNISSRINVNAIVTVTTSSYGGSDIETIESIKFNAPRSWAAQNRAVTADDYKAMILANFADAKSVSVWGGEDNNPPEYGKVFICVNQKSFSKLSEAQKIQIADILKSKKVVTITPVVIDSDYIELVLTVNVYYNPRNTTNSPEEIKAMVLQSIMDYNTNTLENFDGIFRYSQFTKLIDSSEPSVVNSNVDIAIQREITPKYNTHANYTLNVINPIKKGTLSSTGFYIEEDNNICYLDDDGVGNVRVYYYNDATDKVVKYSKIGTIDYANGKIAISDLNIVAIIDTRLVFKMIPDTMNIVSAMTQIVRINEDMLNVVVIPDRTANGDLRAGYNYIFS